MSDTGLRCEEKIRQLLRQSSINETLNDKRRIDMLQIKLTTENDWVRIVRAKYGPNERSHMHEHNSGVVVFLDSTKHQLINEDGSKIDADFKAGDVIWADAATHRAVNLENKPIELVLFELK